MGSCIICGVDIDGGGRICDPHQEDVVFDFRGDSPKQQLVPNRFYRGVVDGYAEFGVFIDLSPGVTGLLHRSELDRRLDSLGWEPGDEVFVQVKGVRDSGNIDLAWSIRQADREFRGVLVQDGDTEHLPEEEGGEESDAEADAEPDELDVADDETADASDDESADVDGAAEPDEGDGDVSAEADEVAKADEADDDGGGADETDEGDESDADEGENESGAESAEDDDLDDERERVEIGTLTDAVGDAARIDGEVVSVRQTGGPTVFEVLDETGVVDVAAFVEPGVRAYPDIGSATRCGSTVRSRATGATCRSSPRRSSSWRARRPRPSAVDSPRRSPPRPVRRGLQPLAGDETVAELADGLLDAAEAIRRAVLESRPIVAPPGHRRRLRRRCRGRARRSSADPRGTREKRRGVPLLHPPAARRPGVRDGRGDERRDPHAAGPRPSRRAAPAVPARRHRLHN